MENRKLLPLMAGLALAGVSSFAHAGLVSDTSLDGDDKSLDCLFNGNSAGGACAGTDGWIEPGSNDLDVNADANTSNAWTIGSSTGSFSKIVIEIAGHSDDNTFGIYDRTDTSNRLEIFSGSEGAGDSSIVEFKGNGKYELDLGNGSDATFASGSNFGFYLSGPGGDFFSDNTENPNEDEQVVAYQGDGEREADFFGTGPSPWLSSEWVLAWEDLEYSGSDQDFNDFAVMVESVTPVPGPAPLALFGAGLLAAAACASRRRRDT